MLSGLIASNVIFFLTRVLRCDINNTMLLRLIIIAVIIILPVSSYSEDNHITKADIIREITWLGIHAIDYGQTLEIARHPDKYKELNPILGKHPSVNNVNIYMITTALLHPIISYILPKEYRVIWQYVTISTSTICVINNYSIGIKINY